MRKRKKEDMLGARGGGKWTMQGTIWMCEVASAAAAAAADPALETPLLHASAPPIIEMQGVMCRGRLRYCH